MPILSVREVIRLEYMLAQKKVSVYVTNSVRKRTIYLKGKLAQFLNLKEGFIVSQCAKELTKSSKIGYVSAAAPYLIVFPCFFLVFLPI